MATAVWLAVTKITAPNKRHDTLRRGRLAEAVGRSVAHSRLTLISAPAGSGKTTLLSELPGAFPDIRFCWLLLDAEDNDPSRFTAALIASMQAATMLPREVEPATNEPRLRITFLINQMTERATGNCVLVLDDLHAITEPAVYEVLDYLLDQAPASFRVILATRHDPPLSLARRRARGEVGEIRLNELNFTEDETGELAVHCLGLTLSSHEVHLLHSKTEGWPAGLRLLASSFSQFPESRALLESGAQNSRQIFDFLAEEVLDRQSPSLRRFLLETSILTRLRADVCDALTGRTDSISLLEDLYQRNLYIAAADERESTFRYHDLFADFLRERLRRERPCDWEALHIRAARAEPFPRDRIRHLLEAKSWEEAAQQIEQIGPEYARLGLVASLRRWISALPETVQDQHPRVLYLFGQAIWILSNFGEAQPYIERALAAFRRTNDHDGQAEATIALANSALMLNEIDRCRDLLDEALTFDIPPAGGIQLHTASGWEAIFRKDLDQATKHIDQVFAMVESGEGRTSPLSLMTVLYAEGINGYVDKCEATCRILRRQLATTPDFSHAVVSILNSAVLVQRGDFASAQSEAARSMSIAEACGNILLIQAALCITFSMVFAVRGDWEKVDQWASLGCDESRHGQVARAWKLHFLYFQARARWHAGNMEGLRQTYDAAMAPNPVEAPPVVVYRSLIEGMMRLAQRSYLQAEQAFRAAVREEAGFLITRTTCSARVMLAYALLARGRGDDAMEVFAPYIQQCEQENVPGRLMFENPLIQPLLRTAIECNLQPSFAGKVLAMLGASLKVAGSTEAEALTEREKQVLRVMAEGLGNRQIGERLFISETTVKTHVQRIMRKLDSTSRTHAIARAREMMLV